MDELHIYNSLTREKDRFKPNKEGFVGIYVCGPTVYGDPHLGHAKSYVSFDVVVRYLRYLGYKVRYVQNITDVGHLTDDADQGEDKLEKQAQIEKLEPMEIAEKYTYNYFRDMDKLGVQRPDISPRATGHIPEQIEMVKKLLEEGHAYEVDGNVYFDVSSDEEYGKLSGRDVEDQEAGTRIETAGDKRDPKDFALWKKAGDDHIMKWNSPWGWGYPGWHLECSVMSTKYLGQNFDIHGGGLDNIFPHHECEIAQSECAYNESFANYWMHNNMVTLNGQKMGKSLGNAISLDEFFRGDHELLTRAWAPQVIRFFLLQSHYRSTTDFTEDALNAAEQGLDNLQNIIRLIEDTEPGDADPFDIEALDSELKQRMNDDFNTAQAIAVLFENLKALRKQINQDEVPSNLDDVKSLLERFVDGVLGIWPEAEEDTAGDDKTEDLVELLIDLRTEARKEKNFEKADKIRDELKEIGIELMDNPDGTTFEIKRNS
ncbi:cysteine--tRNA ligase [Aliifodinibius sp. S!AR15-10]|uniref:cysteine--tRNA ligase n=1 Tax=Aliifodinibius sp. S!AR15-10 TaxID=2950437 RepID=UPI00285509B1|nr:cysteine--tRNA ligase [Aliifodinibius sp. S!AR15-10]MDR8394597.1 cysteine--tRNA ligase [Aliifodinibius sp. S!AR15-10]